jgi:hypothetical protein
MMRGHFPMVSDFPVFRPGSNNISKRVSTTQSIDQYILQNTVSCIQIKGNLKRLTRNICNIKNYI